MKSKHRKYNNGGPVKPKKRKEKVYTDRGLYEKALKAYQDSIALNNYYNLQQEIEPQESEQNKAAFDAMQDLIASGGRDTSRVNELRSFGDSIIEESDGTIQWSGNKKGSYSPDLQYYSVQDDPDKGTLSKMFDKLSTNSLSPMINKASKYWLGNAYNAVWPEPNVNPVYLRNDGLKEMPPKALQLKTTNSKDGIDKINYVYEEQEVDSGERPTITRESMVELPAKLPFSKMDLNRVPPLRRVLPEIYGVKLNQQTGEFIYTTSEGEIRKKQGPDNAQFVSQNRSQIEQLRKNRR